MTQHKHPPVTMVVQAFLSTLLVLLCFQPVGSNFICPNTDPCECDAPEPERIIINCKNKNLFQVPEFESSPTAFYELTLAGNSISLLPENAFTGLNVKRLDITDNLLTNIGENAFSGLEGSLEELLLDANSGVSVEYPTNAIKHLTELKMLQLTGFSIPRLPTGALDDLTKLSQLVIHSSKMNNLVERDLDGPRGSLELLDFKGNEFTSIPFTALQDIVKPFTLKMAQNKMISLSSGSFQDVTMLRHLDLSQNAFPSDAIHEEAFRTLEGSLKSLTLHSSQLNDPSLQAIKRLQALEELTIDTNQIQTIAFDVFDNLRNLQKLQVQGNRLRNIRHETFRGVVNTLKVLQLGDNDGMTINTETFRDFKVLAELHLDKASASQLDDDSFNSLVSSLTILHFKDAGLTSANWPMIAKLTKLETLKLSENDLHPIPDMTFEAFTMLQDLDLSENSIAELPQRALHGLHGSLQALNLNENDLQTISVCALDPEKYTALDIFRLQLNGNPLVCNCHLLWLHRWLMEYKDNFRFNLVNWQCNDGRLFRTLVEDDLTCDPPEAEPECEDLSPTTVAVVPTTAPDTTGAGYPILLSFENLTDTTILVKWDVPEAPEIRHFRLEYFIQNSEEGRQEELYDFDIRSALLQNLRSSTTYQICVSMVLGRTFTPGPRTCGEATTLKSPEGASSASLQLILGAAFGALAFVIVVVVIIVCCICRSRKDDSFDGGELGKFPANRSNIPQAGYNSKRFSRQKPRRWEVDNAMQNIKNKEVDKAMQNHQYRDQELEQKLEGFSPDERDRILQLLRQSGASTLSVVSNASSQRYIPEPPPMRDPNAGYMNPVDLTDEYTGQYRNVRDKHEYEEIPADTYDQIPCDSFI